MKLGAFEITQSDLITGGRWILFHNQAVIGVVSRERRDFLAMFGLQFELPAETTKIMVDPEEYVRLKNQLNSE